MVVISMMMCMMVLTRPKMLTYRLCMTSSFVLMMMMMVMMIVVDYGLTPDGLIPTATAMAMPELAYHQNCSNTGARRSQNTT